MISKILVPYMFRHHYAKAYHRAVIPLTNIFTAIVPPQKYIINVMKYSFQTVRLVYMPSAMGGSRKYGKET